MRIARIKPTNPNANNRGSFPSTISTFSISKPPPPAAGKTPVVVFWFLPPLGQLHLLDAHLRSAIPTQSFGRVAQLQQSLQERGRAFLGHVSPFPSKHELRGPSVKTRRANDEDRRLLRLINTCRWTGSPSVTSRQPGANQGGALIWFKRGETPIQKSDSGSRAGEEGDRVTDHKARESIDSFIDQVCRYNSALQIPDIQRFCSVWANMTRFGLCDLFNTLSVIDTCSVFIISFICCSYNATVIMTFSQKENNARHLTLI